MRFFINKKRRGALAPNKDSIAVGGKTRSLLSRFFSRPSLFGRSGRGGKDLNLRMTGYEPAPYRVGTHSPSLCPCSIALSTLSYQEMRLMSIGHKGIDFLPKKNRTLLGSSSVHGLCRMRKGMNQRGCL